MIKSFSTALAFAGLFAAPLAAKDTFDMPVSLKLLPGWIQSDGSRVAGLQMKLAPGWKTYWRSPGDAGIPPQFSWKGSKNLKGVGITWPAPGVFLTAGMRTIGYDGDFVLPLTLAPQTAGDPIYVRATIDMGICSDICIPHRVTLDAMIDDTNTKPTPAIAAALAERPYSAKDAGVKSATCDLRPTQDGLGITTTISMPYAGGNEIVIVEPGPRDIWMSETKTARQGGTLVAEGEMMSSDGKPVAIDRSGITITVLGSKHAVEIKGCPSG